MSTRVNNRDFVVAYVTSTSVEEAAKTLGVSKASIWSRSRNLRKAGVKLPRFVTHRQGLDTLEVAQLNSLIKQYKKQGITQ